MEKPPFILFSPPTWHKTVLKSHIFQVKNMPKHKKKQWNSWNSPFIFFFPPTWTYRHILFFIFVSPTSQNDPCRDPSTVEYSEPALTDKNTCKAVARVVEGVSSYLKIGGNLSTIASVHLQFIEWYFRVNQDNNWQDNELVLEYGSPTSFRSTKFYCWWFWYKDPSYISEVRDGTLCWLSVLCKLI